MTGKLLTIILAIIITGAVFAIAAGAAFAGEEEEPLTVHYHRYEGDYPEVGLWTWDGTGKKEPPQAELAPSGRDDFGLVFTIDTTQYGLDEQTDRIGLLPRLHKSWDHKDGGDRYWTPDMGREIYLVQGKNIVYKEKPDVSPRALFGYVDAEKEIMLLLSHKMPGEKIKPATFSIRDQNGKKIPIQSARPEPESAKKTRKIVLTLPEALDIQAKSYTISARGYKPSREKNVVPRDILSDREHYYDPDTPLGAVYSEDECAFAVFAPTAEKVFAVLYDEPEGDAGRREIALEKYRKGVWRKVVPGDLKNKYYVYRLEGVFFDPEKEVIDPYARCATGRHGRGMVLDLDETDPPGFDPMKKPVFKNHTDACIYELHVHEYTIDPKSGADKKGYFLGLAETGTRHRDDDSVKTGLDHLKELGITHVQLMPIQDFDNDESIHHQSNWGYMPVHFNNPDGWFATRRDDATRVVELKKMIQGLHDNGIRVIMDVVYNHTAPPASFNDIVPNYYFRMREDGSFWNGSGCGNEFKSENPMARRFIIDSLKYWVTEYGVDGFRFDLMGLIDEKTMIEATRAIHEIDPSIIIYGEPWAAGAAGIKDQTNKGDQKNHGFGCFNDDVRDAIKGSTTGPDGGFVQDGSRAEDVIRGITAAITAWAAQPSEAVIYAACHDDMTLWDKIIKSTPYESGEERKKMQKLAGAIIYTSQGPTFIHSGQEMLRTKNMLENSYAASEELNMIHWDWKLKFPDVYEYYKGMIALRKAHPAFRLPTAEEIEKRITFDEKPPSPKAIGFTIRSQGVPGESAKMIRVLFNADEKPLRFILPEGTWKVLVKDDQAGVSVIEEAEGSVAVKPRTALVCVLE